MKKYPIEGSSHSGEHRAYSVEARWNTDGHREILGQVYTNRWVNIPVIDTYSGLGVPANNELMEQGSSRLGLKSYPAAKALQWWFHATAHAEMSGLFCLETRIVEHKVKYSYSHELIADGDYVQHDKGYNLTSPTPQREETDSE